MKPKKFNTIFENILRKSVKERILKESEGGYEVHHIMCDGKPVETFKTHEEAMDNLGKYKKKFPDKQFIIEKGTYKSYDEMLESFDDMTEDIYELNDVNEVEQDCMECGEMNENKKKTVKMTESQFKKFIKKIVNESVPGAQTLKKTRQESGKDSADYLNDVEKKMKDYLSFDNNDNPEFPKQIGKGEKKVVHTTDEENEEIADNRGYGLQHIKYDTEPSKEFKERLEKAIKGDSTMGNSTEYANAIDSDLGEKTLKQVERKKNKEDGRPLYPKDTQPVKLVREKKSLSEELETMKKMYTYNKKTQ